MRSAGCESTGRLLLAVSPPLALAIASGHQLSYNGGGASDWVLAQLLVWPLVARRRRPVAVITVTLAVALVCWTRHLLLFGYLAVLVALYQVAAERPLARSAAAGVVVEAGSILVAVRFTPASSVNDAVIILTALTMSFLLLGTTRRAQQRYLAALEERAAHLERERGQRAEIAAAQERTRIARELHDIVAHSVSVMITLSEGAAARAVADPPGAHDVMRDVAATGRDALVELRKVVTVLRHGQQAGPRGPQPTLAELPDLVRDFRRSGVPAALRTAGDLASVPASVQANAHRIVQEGLTNVLKHAVDPTSVEVHLRLEDGTLSLLVRDHAVGRPAAGPGGNGLRGMRERVQLLDGTLSAGPASDGWQVACVLPTVSEAR